MSKNKPVETPLIPFNGIARTLECFNNQGFNNFKILTLRIENGMVVAVDKSDPYASFEAICRMELANELAAINLNNNWKDGKTLCK